MLLLVLGIHREEASHQLRVECPDQWQTLVQVHQGLRHAGSRPCLRVVQWQLLGQGVVQKGGLLSGAEGDLFEVYVPVEQCEVV